MIHDALKRYFVALAVLGLALTLAAQNQNDFDAYFLDKAIRVDLFQVGDAKEEFITIDHLVQEGIWPETRRWLIDPFNYGRYAMEVYDIASNRLIYSRGFDGMFGEYKTTSPALNGVKRVFARSVRIPWPKRPVILVIKARDKKNLWHPLFDQTIDPSDFHIIKESIPPGADFIYRAVKSGQPSQSVDLVLVAEGYTAQEKDKFIADVEKFAGWLFETEPFKAKKNRFNVTGILSPSLESGVDEPRQNSYNKTLLGASFNAFDLDRYMLVENGHRLREIAAEIPYDTIVVLVNSKRYGGGGIYADYCAVTADNAASKAVFLHEFGHSFAGLADEYYTSDVSYNDFYPKGIEPLEPNITALLDPPHAKWADLLSPGLAVPTEYGKDKLDALQAEKSKTRVEAVAKAEEAKGLSESEIQRIQEKFKAAEAEIQQKIEDIRKEYAPLYDKVGVFEGAGYSAKGLYRPMIDCLMISSPRLEYCLVCRRAVSRMIDYYAED